MHKLIVLSMYKAIPKDVILIRYVPAFRVKGKSWGEFIYKYWFRVMMAHYGKFSGVSNYIAVVGSKAKK